VYNYKTGDYGVSAVFNIEVNPPPISFPKAGYPSRPLLVLLIQHQIATEKCQRKPTFMKIAMETGF
jgi:hypothetical protein